MKQAKSLSKELKKIIKRMRKIQKGIASDGQPVSGYELTELCQLGERYQDVMAELTELDKEHDKSV